MDLLSSFLQAMQRKIIKRFRVTFLACLRADVSYFLCCKGNRRRLHAQATFWPLQTSIRTTWPRFSLLYLSFKVDYIYINIRIFRPDSSIRMILDSFYLLISKFEKLPPWIWRLPFCRIKVMRWDCNRSNQMKRASVGFLRLRKLFVRWIISGSAVYA